MRGGCGGHHCTSTEQLEIGGVLLVGMRAGICATTCGKGRSDEGEEEDKMCDTERIRCNNHSTESIVINTL